MPLCRLQKLRQGLGPNPVLEEKFSIGENVRAIELYLHFVLTPKGEIQS